MYFAIMTLDSVLSSLSVSGRKSDFLPKVWAFLGESENKVKFTCTKRVRTDILALGNGSKVKAQLRLEGANKKSTFVKDGQDIEFYETRMRWVITNIVEVLDQGTLPQTSESKQENSAEDTIPA